MNEIINGIISQWGLVGLVGMAAAWVIYDNFKANKEKEKIIEEKLLDNTSRTHISDSLSSIHDKIDHIEEETQRFRSDMEERIAILEEKFNNKPDKYSEAHKLEMIAKVAPSIHSLLETSMDDINADHMYVALLHNGVNSICGTPFLKFDIVAEKYYPLKNPKDIELSPIYKNEDIMSHNQLFPTLFQNKTILFDIKEGGRLATIDSNLYNRLLTRGVKQAAFGIFRDQHGIPNGFLCAYNFNGIINEKNFQETLSTLGTIYKDITNL